MSDKLKMQDIISDLRADFEQKQQQAKADFEKKMAEHLETIKKNVRKWLQDAHANFEFLQPDEQAAVLNDADIKKIFASFGYVRRKDKDDESKGGRYDETAILAFLADGAKEQKAIMEKFGVSKQSISAWGKKLVEAGKVKIDKNGRERVWSKV